jgi:hypothetical protein
MDRFLFSDFKNEECLDDDLVRLVEQIDKQSEA